MKKNLIALGLLYLVVGCKKTVTDPHAGQLKLSISELGTGVKWGLEGINHTENVVYTEVEGFRDTAMYIYVNPGDQIRFEYSFYVPGHTDPGAGYFSAIYNGKVIGGAINGGGFSDVYIPKN